MTASRSISSLPREIASFPSKSSSAHHRPRGTAQYILALRDWSDPLKPKRFDFGFIGSSDNHTSRPGTGYKEFGRGDMTEGRGADPNGSPISGGGSSGSSNDADEPAAESVPYT